MDKLEFQITAEDDKHAVKIAKAILDQLYEDRSPFEVPSASLGLGWEGMPEI